MQTLQQTIKDGYAIVTLDRGKANPINGEMVTELRQLMKENLENDEVGGVILNGKENFFSAGLDVIELYGYDEPTIEAFWKNFFEMVYELASFRKPLIASITGHSPAGGCVLAVCCDYRVMAEGKYQIGLNEIPVGIMVNDSISALYAFWMGDRTAYQYLMEGRLMQGQEALENGLVDELVAADQVLAAAEAKMKHYLQFGRDVWQNSKMMLRKDVLERVGSDQEAKRAATLKQWWNPVSRKTLEHIIAKLKK